METAVNSVGDEAMMTDRPSAARRVCTAMPACTPATVASPTRGPDVMLWRRISSVSGPGEITTAEAATTKAPSVAGSTGNGIGARVLLDGCIGSRYVGRAGQWHRRLAETEMPCASRGPDPDMVQQVAINHCHDRMRISRKGASL